MARKITYKIICLIITPVVFAFESVYNFSLFYKYKEGMSMIGGIVFGAMFLFYSNDLYEYFFEKKSINS
ncbi:MAG TPA: hypothetical protein PK987_11940 [Ferruginibacter sp.]|nr:hypothetical protein [Ferruginibacter sp.]